MGLKHPKNALVLNPRYMTNDDVFSMFQTVFILDSSRQVKKKNVIYRENIESINEILDIDIIFIDSDGLNLLKKLQGVWRKSKSIIHIEGPLPHISYQDLLRLENFEILEISKDYTIWKQKK